MNRLASARPVRLYRRLLQSEGAFTPPSITSPHNRQREKLHNPVSTFPGEGHLGLAEPADVPQLKVLLAPDSLEELICGTVSAGVGNVKTINATVIDPLTGLGERPFHGWGSA